MTVRPAKT